MKKSILLLFSFLFVTSTQAQIDLEDGLIAYYPFIGNADDASGNALDGKVFGAELTSDRAGNESNAYYFDGIDDYIDFGKSLTNLDLPFPVSLWLERPKNTSSRTVFASNDNSTNYRGFFMSLNDTETLVISFGDGGITGESSRRSIESSLELPEDSWVHVVAVMRSANDMSMYFDGLDTKGILLGSGGAAMVSGDDPARIGYYDLGYRGTPWVGGIDDVRVYNRALTLEEVGALYELEPEVGESVESILITEIMKNPEDVADSAGEWFELFNPSDDAVNIDGWILQDLGTDIHMIDNGGELLVGPKQALVFCKDANREANGDVPCDYRYTGIFLSNREDAIILLNHNEEEVDRVAYDDGDAFPSPNGASLFYTAGPADDNNHGSNWTASFERAANYGNTACPTCDDLGSPGIVDTGFLPVELTAFDVKLTGNHAILSWETASEANNAGFEIYQGATDVELQKIGWLGGAGFATQPQKYSYQLHSLAPGEHRFQLKQVDFDGKFSWSRMISIQVGLQNAYHVSAPYPNPFNPTTTFSFSVQQGQHVVAKLYNMLGQKVATLFDQEVGDLSFNTIRVSGHSLTSGHYVIRVAGDHFVVSQQVYLVK